ncbi:MAG: DUF362 domain-containing protein [Anaerolineae bacterium]
MAKTKMVRGMAGGKENIFVKDGRPLVSKAHYGGDLRASIEQAVAAIGGFERLIREGDSVLVKPNFNTAHPPPGSGDPLFVKTVIELLYEHGAEKVVLGESSMVGLSTVENLKRTGMWEAAREAGAEVVDFKEGEWVRTRVRGRYLRGIALARAAVEAEKIVYLPCMKTHRLAEFSLSLKLAMGFVKPIRRIPMHLWRLSEKLAELNLAIAPDLIIMDGRRCFIRGGPSDGELRKPDLVLASGDRVAIDVEALKLIKSYPGHALRKDVWDLTMIKHAVQLGLGPGSEEGYRVVGVNGD